VRGTLTEAAERARLLRAAEAAEGRTLLLLRLRRLAEAAGLWLLRILRLPEGKAACCGCLRRLCAKETAAGCWLLGAERLRLRTKAWYRA
jgi:hypothetical protein